MNIEKAKEIICKEFEKTPELKLKYIETISSLLENKLEVDNLKALRVATSIVKILFGV
jgi:hypothetical protein